MANTYITNSRNCNQCGATFHVTTKHRTKRFCSHSCWAKSRKGASAANWKGGRSFHKVGYVRLRIPDHPRACHGYVLEHIVIAEQMLGRPLHDTEVVHHRDHNKSNNSPENLEILTESEHKSLHMKERHSARLGLK